MQIKYGNLPYVVQGLQASISSIQSHSVHIDTSVMDLQTKSIDLTDVVKITAHFGKVYKDMQAQVGVNWTAVQSFHRGLYCQKSNASWSQR